MDILISAFLVYCIYLIIKWDDGRSEEKFLRWFRRNHNADL